MSFARIENLLVGLGALIVAGAMTDVYIQRVVEQCKEKNEEPAVAEYDSISLRLAGAAGIVAYCALIWKNYGLMAVALVVSVVACLRYLMPAVNGLSAMKNAGWSFQETLRFRPSWVWGRMVALGVWKWFCTVCYLTIIFMPAVGVIENGFDKFFDRREQKMLELEYETGVPYEDKKQKQYLRYQNLVERS